jgi:hypothetical protein
MGQRMNSVTKRPTKRPTGLGVYSRGLRSDRGKPVNNSCYSSSPRLLGVFAWRPVIGSERVDQCGSFGSFGPFLLGVFLFLSAGAVCVLWLPGCCSPPP